MVIVCVVHVYSLPALKFTPRLFLSILNSTLFSSSHVTAMLKTEKLPSEGQKPAASFGVPHTSVTRLPCSPRPRLQPLLTHNWHGPVTSLAQ